MAKASDVLDTSMLEEEEDRSDLAAAQFTMSGVQQLHERESESIQYMKMMMAASGVPQFVPGTEIPFTVEDQVMYLLSQYGIVQNALSTLRTDLMSLAHRKRREDSDTSEELFDMLAASQRVGTSVMVSDV